jgi:hypothetical protein
MGQRRLSFLLLSAIFLALSAGIVSVMGIATSNRRIPHPAVSGLAIAALAAGDLASPALTGFPAVTGSRKGCAEAVAENTTEAAPISSVASIDKRQ